MSDLSSSACASRSGLDPRKRVNFTTGLVLGEDEFVQEQTYLRERDHAGVRSLHGYGTVSGLAVSWDGDARQIRVAPGLAIDPAGRLVCVPATQCADLPRWLNDRQDEVEAAIEAGGQEDRRVDLYVVLCHRECATDTVPVPTESCRTADESMAASRILESFELRLLFTPPVPAGEPAGGRLDAAVQRLLELSSLVRDDDEVDRDTLRQELREWATHQRPELEDHPCLSAPDDDCGDNGDGPSTAVLLARVELRAETVSGGAIEPRDPVVDDADRPILLSTRYLQEWLTALISHPELLAPRDHRLLENLDADDHPQYLLVDGSRPLTGHLNAGNNVVLNLQRSDGPTHAMRRDEIVGLDLEHTQNGLRISHLQGEEVAASGEQAPREGDVLRYDGRQWVPAELPTPELPELPDPPERYRLLLPFVTIHPVGRRESISTFVLWFHLEAPDATERLSAELLGTELAYGENVRILNETCEDGELVLGQVQHDVVEIEPIGCNVFRLDVDRQDAELLRFVFHLDQMLLEPSGMLVNEFAERVGIGWVGQGEDATVTSFVVNPSHTQPLPGIARMDAIVPPGGGGRIPIDRS